MFDRKSYKDAVIHALKIFENDTNRVREIMELLEDAYNEGYEDAETIAAEDATGIDI